MVRSGPAQRPSVSQESLAKPALAGSPIYSVLPLQPFAFFFRHVVCPRDARCRSDSWAARSVMSVTRRGSEPVSLPRARPFVPNVLYVEATSPYTFRDYDGGRRNPMSQDSPPSKFDIPAWEGRKKGRRKLPIRG